MSTDPATTVKLGDLVVVAFDWAEQHGSDVREVRILGVKAVSYLLQHARTTSSSRSASGFLPLRGSRERPVLVAAGRRPGVSAPMSG
ncbi:MAG TPA: hypothetical protein VLT32_20935 [Candidatus Sulfomarinibacteraceae bacterium]|nr:hypothetical protein [Candidatus Sulfomarinibacteraceae bacterium]